MSATGRSTSRPTLDYCPTPRWCVARELEADEIPGGLWSDPCGGDGAIVRAVRSLRPDVTMIAGEVQPQFRPLLQESGAAYVTIGDAHQYEAPDDLGAIITNPPYLLADTLIRAWLQRYPRIWIVALLRLNWLASQSRAWLSSMMPDTRVLPDRPSFYAGATDATEYAWIVFPPGLRARARRTATIARLAETPDLERKADARELARWRRRGIQALQIRTPRPNRATT